MSFLKTGRQAEPDANPVNHDGSDVNSVSSDEGMYAKSTISHGKQRVKCATLCDSGAEANYVSISVIRKMGRHAPRIRPLPKDYTASSCTGSGLNLIGSVKLSIQIGSKARWCQFWVTSNLVLSAILGRIQLAAWKCDSDFKSVTFPDGERVMLFGKKEASRTISSLSTVTIQPHSKKWIKCATFSKINCGGSYVIEPAKAFENNATRGLVDIGSKGSFDYLMYNTSPKPITINRKSPIGVAEMLQPSDMICYTNNEDFMDLVEPDPDHISSTLSYDNKVPNKIKRKNRNKPLKKPTFSRPLVEEDLSDEEIIRKYVKFDRKLLTEEEREDFIQKIIELKDAFSLRGETGASKSYSYSLRMKPTFTRFFRTNYKLSDHETELMKAEVKKLIKIGVIEEVPASEGYLPSCSAALLVSKGDGSARLTVDMRILNTHLQIDKHSMSSINDVLLEVGKAAPSFFCQLDLESSFYQIPLADEESKAYTTFAAYPNGHFRFCCLPMGLANSSSALARLCSQLFGKIKGCSTYCDDILGYSTTVKGAIEVLLNILRAAIDDNIKFSLRKSMLLADEAQFVGCLIKNGVIKPLQRHISSILNMSPPKDKRQLKRLLGASQWLQKYTKSYATMTQPLYDLLKKRHTTFLWTKEHDAALQNLKEYFTTAPVLKLPSTRPEDRYLLFIDGSKVASGSVLMQRQQGKLFVVGYFSKALSPEDIKTPTPTHLEITSLDKSLLNFRKILYNPVGFDCYTDHSALLDILKGTQPPKTTKIGNCLSRITEYNMRLHYLKGRSNTMADFQSRMINKAISNTEKMQRGEAVETEDIKKPQGMVSEDLINMMNEETPTREPPRRSGRLSNKNQTPQSPADNQNPSGSKTRAGHQPDSTPADPTADEPNTSQNPTVDPLRRSRRLAGEAPELGELPTRPKNRTTKPPTLTMEGTGSPTTPGILKSPNNIPDTIKPSIQLNDVPITRSFRTTDPPETVAQRHEPTSENTRPHIPASNPTLEQLEQRELERPGILPEETAMFQNQTPTLTFPDKFHFTVPRRTQQRIRDILKQKFNSRLSLELVIEEQRNCPYLRPLILYLEHRKLPNAKQEAKRVLNMEDNYFLVDRALMKIPNPTKFNRGDSRIQLVIPESLAEEIIKQKHCCTGHSGFAKSMMAIRRNFYIHQLSARLRRYINTCGLCLKLKKQHSNDKIPLTSAAGKSAHRPFSFIQMDYKSLDLKGVESKFKKILVTVDEFTGFTWLKATTGESSEEAAKYLLRLTKRLGMFTSISSDRGSAFTSYIMDYIARAKGFQWPIDSVHQPQSTGLVESRVALCSELLRHAILRYPKLKVKDILPDIQGAINSVESTSMGVSPFYAFHGWQPIDVTDSACGLDKPLTNQNKILLETVVAENKLRMELTKKARELASKETKHRHDAGIVNVPFFKQGDLVIVDTHDHPLSSQTSRKEKVRRAGPFHVVHVDRFQALLKDLKGCIIPDMVSLRKLKKIEEYNHTFPVDYADKTTDPVVAIHVSEKTRENNNRKQHLVYPKDDGGFIQRKSGFWLDIAVEEN